MEIGVENIKKHKNCYYSTDNGILFCGDCLEVMQTIGFVDILLTDPPYGIGMDKGFKTPGKFEGSNVRIKCRQYNDNWDAERPSKEIFDNMLKIAKLCLIFGGNFFADILPLGTHWIVWDKKTTMPTFGDAELIWTNSKRKSIKIFVYEYNGLFGKEKERFHPTQKPVVLIMRLLDRYSKLGDLVLDCFLGSGTTAIACERLGRKWIGIEKDEKYCEIAAKRLETETSQLKLLRID